MRKWVSLPVHGAFSHSLPPRHVSFLSQSDCHFCFFSVSANKLQNPQSSLPFFSPLPLQCWSTYLTHALFVFVYFIFAVRRRRDSSNLLWYLSRHTWLPPFIYAHIFAKWCSVGQTLLFSPQLKVVLSLTGFSPQMVRCKLWICWH